MYQPMEIKHRATPPMGKLKIENFYGADLTNDPSNVHPTRSPECPNMIRTTSGKVGKRPGFHTVKTYAGQINGVHFLYGTTTKKLVHAGTKLYLDGEVPTELYATMADKISISHQMAGKLIIQDGTTMLIYDGTTVKPVSDGAYIPTVIIAGTPTGGGELLEPRNIVQPKVKYRAAGTASDKIFQLPDNTLDAETVVVQKLNALNGEFDIYLVENTDFTVNRTAGKVTFTTEPGVSPIVGEDNLIFSYAKTFSGEADRINKTDISILYGLNGARDRLFVAGSGNVDYFCQMNDPTYWGEYSFSIIGQDSASIMGYSIINEKLATHKNNAENDTNTILRKGTLLNGEIAFIMDGAYQGSGVISKRSMANLENEPLFVSSDNTINAVTPSDVLGERYSQQRSYYLNGALQNEDLSQSYACVWNQFYLLAVGSKVYILDGTQFFTERNTPFSHRQYAGFYWTGINARVMWVEDDALYFGDADGNIKAFYDGTLRTHYNDDGVAIPCYWDTSMDTGETFAMKKTYSYIGLRLGAFVATGVKIQGKIQGIWNLLMDYTAEANYLDFNDVNFADFSFSTDSTPRTVGQKIKIKNVDKTQFRFENSRLNQPFELYEAYVEFVQSGYYRK